MDRFNPSRTLTPVSLGVELRRWSGGHWARVDVCYADSSCRGCCLVWIVAVVMCQWQARRRESWSDHLRMAARGLYEWGAVKTIERGDARLARDDRARGWARLGRVAIMQ